MAIEICISLDRKIPRIILRGKTHGKNGGNIRFLGFERIVSPIVKFTEFNGNHAFLRGFDRVGSALFPHYFKHGILCFREQLYPNFIFKIEIGLVKESPTFWKTRFPEIQKSHFQFPKFFLQWVFVCLFVIISML